MAKKTYAMADNGELDQELTAIRRKHREACRDEVNARMLAHYRKYFPDIKTLMVSGDQIDINGDKVLIVSMDEYLNINCAFPAPICVPLLEPMAYIVENKFEQPYGDHAYKFRTLQTLLIRYWQQHYMAISAKELVEMLEISLRLPCERRGRNHTGFCAYLLTRSYVCTDGGALCDFQFREWPHRKAFDKLRKSRPKLAAIN